MHLNVPVVSTTDHSKAVVLMLLIFMAVCVRHCFHVRAVNFSTVTTL